jgi:FlaA1/EpsC-like NDP-sugar epimerase
VIDLRSHSALETLLGRPVCHVLTEADLAAFAGRRVLVTGAGGSVGSELARHLAAAKVASLTLFDQSEHALFEVERELSDRWPSVPIEPVLADLTRFGDIATACRRARPDVIYHAAAYKHVTMAERAVCAAIRTNVLGTHAVTRAAAEVGARLVVISTDKAAEPRSVMGATKRMAEIAALTAHRGFAPVVIRFGNVLGSSGSVLAIMAERICEGRPLPLTHPDVTRYLMTAGEAVSLVMKTDLIGRGGEIHWLDMGAPVKVLELAKRLIELGVAAGYARVPIEICGLRPGEKLAEDLIVQGLELRETPHPAIWVARQAPLDLERVERSLASQRAAVAAGNAVGAIVALRDVVREFVPSDFAWEAARRLTAQRPAAMFPRHRATRPAPGSVSRTPARA